LLVNSDHPAADDQLRTWAVDDGWGYKAPDGTEYRFIAYYTWQLWNNLVAAARNLAWAYILTGEQVYAHKAALLLDRIADCYPDMDWAPYAKRGWFHSDGGSGQGKINGAIWECGTLQQLAEAYDMIKSGLDVPSLHEFLKRQAARWKLPTPKGSAESIARNIEDRILRCGAEAVIAGRIRGNEGMHQLAIAWAAVALDSEPDTSRFLDWIFQADGGRLPSVIFGRMDRDGVGEEGGPGYALGWGSHLGELANLLSGYEKYKAHNLYQDFPRLRNSFVAGIRMTVLDMTTPNIGDSGATGTIGIIGPSVRQILAAYRACKNPELAVAAWIRARRDEKALWIDEYDPGPGRWAKEVREAVARVGEQALIGPDHMAGYGLVSLEVGRGAEGTAAWMFYGQNYGHGHRDRLNLGIYGYGLDLAPDLGYPEFATRWPKRGQWTTSTISHNTVVVDRRPQARDRIGRARLFKVLPASDAPDAAPLCEIAEVASPEVYGGLEEYARTVVLVPVSASEAYIVDIFRVVGGRDHIWSFHGPPGEPGLLGLQPVPQGRGTYAGPDVPFGPGLSGEGEGFSWLHDVQRQESPPSQWAVDFLAEKGYRGSDGTVHLRLHFLAPVHDVALALGDPPHNKPGNPRSLPYVLAHRRGNGLRSCFVAVFDPWRQRPHVETVSRAVVKGATADMAAALRIQLTSGAVDWILCGPTPDIKHAADGGPQWTGKFAFIRERDGQIEAIALAEGSSVSWRGVTLQMSPAAWTGTVARFETDPAKPARIWLAGKLPGTARGQEVYVSGDPERNPVYRIGSVEEQGALVCIDCGSTDFVAGHVDETAYERGYRYEIAQGQRWRVPNHCVAARRGGRLAVVAATAPAQVTETGK
ncbi:MAG: heparinase II/III family protein, partial [Armatimonadetes bacterium]|nr:heparinase II/III family protein [Armatimonadota bacterium]